MCDVLKTQLLGALKDNLQDVEGLKLIPEDDLKLPVSKRICARPSQL